MIGAAVLGILVANPTIQTPAFVGFNVNGDTGDTAESTIGHLNILAENDGFQCRGTMAQNHLFSANHNSFKIGSSGRASEVANINCIFQQITISVSTVGNTYNTFPDFHVPYVLVNTDKMISYI